MVLWTVSKEFQEKREGMVNVSNAARRLKTKDRPLGWTAWWSRMTLIRTACGESVDENLIRVNSKDSRRVESEAGTYKHLFQEFMVSR